MLDDFESSLNNARALQTTGAEIPLAVKVAVIGFAQFSPVAQWSRQHFEFINKRLQGELSLESLAWYEGCAEAVAVFACFAIGALLGKFQSGEIDDAGFLLGDAHLAGFLSLHSQTICARYV